MISPRKQKVRRSLCTDLNKENRSGGYDQKVMDSYLSSHVRKEISSRYCTMDKLIFVLRIGVAKYNCLDTNHCTLLFVQNQMQPFIC